MKGGIQASLPYIWVSKHMSEVEDHKYSGKIIALGPDGILEVADSATPITTKYAEETKTKKVVILSGGSGLSVLAKCRVCDLCFKAGFNRYGGRDGVCPKCQKQIKYQKLQQIMDRASSVSEGIARTAEAFGCTRQKAAEKLGILWKSFDYTIIVFMSTILSDPRQTGNITPYAHGKVGPPKNRLRNVWERDKGAVYYACPSCAKVISIPAHYVDSYGLIGDRHCITCSRCGSHTYPYFEDWFKVRQILDKVAAPTLWPERSST